MVEDAINELRTELMEYGELVGRMIEKSIAGLLERDRTILSDVMENEGPKGKDLTIRLDERCAAVIALDRCKAGDIKTILTVVKVNNYLGRMANHAVNICENALILVAHPPVKLSIDITGMTGNTMTMVRDSLNALVAKDAVSGKTARETTRETDAFLDRTIRDLVTRTVAEPKTIEQSLRLITVARDLERIADLSGNIHEDVISMTRGKAIRRR